MSTELKFSLVIVVSAFSLIIGYGLTAILS
ncbi:MULTISPECIES: cytochrome bd-I oxidase subunit CydH [unclassified Vibrio]|nr:MULTISPECIES: YnhF family membrane protein [unclassified Vibrio]